MNHQPKLLIIAEECHPHWPSVPRVVYKTVEAISRQREIVLVSHGRNGAALRASLAHVEIHVLEESTWEAWWFRCAKLFSLQFRLWPILHAMNWVLHEMFRHRVNRQFHERVLKGEFGGVLALSPMIPRYAMPLARACGLSGCPLVIGPVNGGLDYPKGWKRLAFSEGAWLHPLRYFASNYPPFKEAYLGATKVLCGSWNCLEKIQGIFPQISTRLSYCPENGLDSSEILPTPLPKAPGAIHLIFVGRLVDYKGPMILLKALNLLSPELKKNVTLQVVGDGALKITMQKFCQRHHLENLVSFTGQLTRDKVLKSLSESDLMVFPSVREFGGGVVLESFSQGCPVLIANRGGPAELAGIGTGYRCPVHAPNKMTMVLADLLGKIISSPKELDSMRSECLRRAREFTWDKKALEILNCFDSGN